MIRLWTIALVCFALFGGGARAQFDAPPTLIFLVRDVDGAGGDRLVWIDQLTGSERRIDVDGDRYTVLPGGVMYWDAARARVMFADRAGNVGEHPFIQPSVGARRIDWALSPDRSRLAWTIVEGEAGALVTTTYTARADGVDLRPLLSDGARDGVRVYPVGFTDDNARLILDYQPDTIGDLTPFRQYAGLFTLDLASGAGTPLPGEPACFCGAGVGGSLFVRMTTGNGDGFAVRVASLADGASYTLPALDLPGYTQGGDVLIAPDGSRAVYALAQVTGFGTGVSGAEVVYGLIDLAARTQTTLVEPITSLLHPVAWTENNSAILFTHRERNGTWKLNLADGQLAIVAEGVYLGAWAAASAD